MSPVKGPFSPEIISSNIPGSRTVSKGNGKFNNVLEQKKGEVALGQTQDATPLAVDNESATKKRLTDLIAGGASTREVLSAALPSYLDPKGREQILKALTEGPLFQKNVKA
jgi:hypothetical protein